MVLQELLDMIKTMLREDLDTLGDVSPHGMPAIKAVLTEYRGRVSDEAIERVDEDARWLVLYFMRCRHMARPIDRVLAGNVIDNLGGFLSFGG